jgi:D-amino-acid dehydrogenase
VTKHVAITGAGVIGLCTALYCLERGWQVTVVERNGAQRDACSFGNAGMIVPSHIVPLAAPGAVAQALKWMLRRDAPFRVKPRASWELAAWGLDFVRAATADHVKRAAPLLRDLHLASRACYEELARDGNGFGFTRTGTLMLCKTGHALDEEAKAAQLARDLGMQADVLDARATAALDPGVRMDVVGAVHFPQDANVVPDRLVRFLERRVAERGGRLRWDTTVAGFRLNDGRIGALTTRSGEAIEADAFVVAAGAWSQQLARMLGIRLPLQAGKGYSVTLPHPRVRPGHCAILVEARVAVSPMGDALRVGGTMEMAGLDQTVDPIRVRSIVQAMPRYYPQFSPADFDGLAPWNGLRPCSPDGLPYLGRSRKASNVVVAAGHAMMGVSLAPITGTLMAQVLSGEATSIAIDALSPDRYASRHKSRVRLDFSRKVESDPTFGA